MSSFQLLFLLPSFFFHFVHCSPSPILEATIDNVTNAYYNCTRNTTSATNNAYHSNIKTLLEWLSSNSSNSLRYYNTTVASQNSADTVYGSFLCVRDIDPRLCQLSVIEAAKLISSLCTTAAEAIVWYSVCYVRYSDRRFFSTVEKSPELSFMNDKNYVGQVERFNNILWDMLNNLRIETANASTKFAEKSVNLTDNQKLYGFTWCVPYLSKENCGWCLTSAIAEVPTTCCRGKSGGSIYYPSCGVRFELYPFHKELGNIPWVPPATSPYLSALPGKGKQKTLTLIVIVVPIVVSLVVLALGYRCFLYRKERKNQHDILKESFGNDIATFESLQFELAKIYAATNRFAAENRIGKGGFGEVYKGILSDGQEIAVKRLTRSSGQGAVEFKNEVQVIAKLQHRNLVRLLGFCLEDEEKILIYEYVPNKSLDYFLFDPQKRKLLSWSQRQKIIKGIVRGILYLHEDSRLKIIHRDLKPSNVLLDSNMNPKISDFGMARIMYTDQIEESTGRIVGTYGYISPEYAMHGYFSVKSDVFSFGIMVLEIISGKRKGCSAESECVDDIRRYAWKKWAEQTPLELVDPHIEGTYSQEEVIKYIHIGLLCVQEVPEERPTMATIAFYLNSPSINLPSPLEPPYFKRSGIEENTTQIKELDIISDSTNGIT
ncbi:cysteine-rich receptor-like protein kinase 25 isoform X2 [Cicer arietinum]|uniref:Cysteine-rich receptor-like protein kinase 25 n=1 Tax=Cicer arietinum TaxID=3827 RepID=A0A1S2XZ22_CICAR|nr:cysteine-rich receptor-like protein kinase 25 [Cicer arietinum]